MILECRRLSDRLLQLTAGDADDGLRLQAHHSAWATCLFAGEPAAAREHCEAGRRLYDPERHRSHRLLLWRARSRRLCAATWARMAHWLLGYPERAWRLAARQLALAERLAHPLSLEIALLFNAMLHLDRGEPELALRRLAAAEALVAEQRLAFIVEPRFLRGAALSAQGASGRPSRACARGLPVGSALCGIALYGLARLAEALARQGEHVAALPRQARDWRREKKRVTASGRQNFSDLSRLSALGSQPPRRRRNCPQGGAALGPSATGKDV